MAIGVKSSKDAKQLIKANKIFTDRVEPRKAFWDTYFSYKNNMDTGIGNDIKLLTYYGIGGIGKTTLLHKIASEIDEYKEDQDIKEHVPHIYYDFDWGTNKISVLEKMRDELVKKYKFRFPVFNAAVAIYKEKSESGTQKKEKKGYFSENEILGTAGDFIADGADILNFVPGVGPAALSTMKLVDVIIAKAVTYNDDRKDELIELKEAPAHEIFEMIQVKFAQDIEYNMQKHQYPLVVFLDTYEQLVNELKNAGQPLNNDKWLRSVDNGLVVYSPNTIWVIAGREILKWDQINSDWAENLKDQQHIMGALSYTDTMEFLEDSKVGEEDIKQAIYDITDGTPVYLDICVSNYFSAKERGETVTRERIGNNRTELMERFLRYTDDIKEELLYVLACIGFWKEDEIVDIVSGIIPGVTGTAIRNMSNYSFIEQAGEGFYKLHKIIGSVLIEKCDPILKRDVNRFEQSFYQSRLENYDVHDGEFTFYLERYIQNTLELGVDSDEMLDIFNEYIDPRIKKLTDIHQNDIAFRLFSPYMTYMETIEESEIKAKLFHKTADFYYDFKEYSEAHKYIQEAEAICDAKLSANDPLKLKCMNTRAVLLYQMDRKEESQELTEIVFNKRSEVLGLEDVETQLTQLNLSIFYSKEGRHREAVEISREVYETRASLFGESNIDTLKARRVYAINLRGYGYQHSAIDIFKKVYNTLVETVGSENRTTVKTANNLISTLREVKAYDEALAMAKDMVKEREEHLGKHHRITLNTFYTIGTLYNRLENYPEMVNAYQEAYERYLDKYDSDDVDLLDVQTNLSTALKNNNELEKSISLLENLYEKQVEKFGRHDKKTLTSIHNLSNRLIAAKRYEEALRYLTVYQESFGITYDEISREGRQLLDMFRLAYGRNKQKEKSDVYWSRYIDRLRSYGNKLYGEKKYKEAEIEYAILKKCYKNGSSAYINTLSRYAHCLYQNNKEDEALGHAEEALTLLTTRDKLEEDSIAYVSDLIDHIKRATKNKEKRGTLISAYKERFEAIKPGKDKADLKSARGDLERLLQEVEENFDTKSILYYSVAGKLGTVNYGLSAYDEAMKWMQACLDYYKEISHPMQEDTERYLNNIISSKERAERNRQLLNSVKMKREIGIDLFEQGRYEQALGYFTEAIHILKTDFGSGLDVYDELLTRQGMCYGRLEDYDTSNAIFDELLAYYSEDPQKNHQSIAKTMRLKMFYKRCQLGDDILKEKIDQLQGYISKADGLLKDNQFDEAKTNYEKALTIAEELFSEYDDTMINVLNNFGMLLFEIKAYNRAIEYAKKVVESYKREKGVDNEKTLKKIELLKLYLDIRCHHLISSDLKDELIALYKKSYKLYQENQFEEAFELGDELYNRSSEVFDDDHSFYIEVMNLYGTYLAAQGKYDQAITVIEKVYNYYNLLYGDQYKTTQQKHAFLEDLENKKTKDLNRNKVFESVYAKFEEAMNFYKTSNYKDALTLLDECIVSANKDLKEYEKFIAKLYLEKGKALARIEQYEVAKEMLDKTNDLYASFGSLDEGLMKELDFYRKFCIRQIMGQEQVDRVFDMVISFFEEGNRLSELKEHLAAIVEYDKALSHFYSFRSEDNKASMSIHANRAFSFMRLDKFDPAIEGLEKVVAFHIENTGEDEEKTLKMISALTSVKNAKAESIVGRDKVNELLVMNSDILEVIKEGDHKRAVSMYKVLYERAQVELPEGHELYVDILNNYAVCLEEIDDYNQSIELMNEVVAEYNQRYGPTSKKAKQKQGYLSYIQKKQEHQENGQIVIDETIKVIRKSISLRKDSNYGAALSTINKGLETVAEYYGDKMTMLTAELYQEKGKIMIDLDRHVEAYDYIKRYYDFYLDKEGENSDSVRSVAKVLKILEESIQKSEALLN